jgi:tetratricopeptide (TPR) repeat protein
MVDCLAVAEILESEGEMESARQMYGQAVTVSESRPAALGALAEFLLRREKAEEALLLAEQLEQSSPSPRAFSLKLACWNALERSDEIDQALQDRETTLLEDAGEDPRRRAAALVSLGADCMGIGRFEQAEALFRRAVELDPAAKSALSAALSAQKKSGEALSSAIDLFNTRSTQAAAMAVFQVISGMPVDELKASPDVDPFLAKAVESFPNDVRLLLEAAATRIRQDRGDDAIALYEKVLTIAPNQPATLNNLAALLTYKPQRQEEALKHVDKALALFGNRAIPAVLDTKGTILLAMGRNDQALQWLEKAIAPEEADPVHLLHAAVAYLRTGERGRAEESFKLAQERGLAEAELQKHDIDLKSELEEALQ